MEHPKPFSRGREEDRMQEGCRDEVEVGVREEEGLAFQYPERITGQALDAWSLQSFRGLRDGCIKGGEGRGMNIEVTGWREVSGAAL